MLNPILQRRIDRRLNEMNGNKSDAQKLLNLVLRTALKAFKSGKIDIGDADVDDVMSALKKDLIAQIKDFNQDDIEDALGVGEGWDKARKDDGEKAVAKEIEDRNLEWIKDTLDDLDLDLSGERDDSDYDDIANDPGESRRPDKNAHF
jgi:hypothetical protein